MKLEKIQRSIVQYVMNDYSYFSSVTAMMHQLNWPTLELQRNYIKLIMLYKIAKGLIKIPSILLTLLRSNTRRHPYWFWIPPARINSYLHFFAINKSYGTALCITSKCTCPVVQGVDSVAKMQCMHYKLLNYTIMVP